MRSVSATNGLNTAEGGQLGAPSGLVGFMIGAVLESAILLVIDGVRGVVTETTVECTTARLNCYILATDQLRAGLWPSVDPGLAGVPLGSPRPHTTWARVGPSACRAVRPARLVRPGPTRYSRPAQLFKIRARLGNSQWEPSWPGGTTGGSIEPSWACARPSAARTRRRRLSPI